MAHVAVMATSSSDSSSMWSMSSLRSALPRSSPISVRFPVFPPPSSSSATLRISRTKPKSLLPSFTGLTPLHHLPLSAPPSSGTTTLSLYTLRSFRLLSLHCHGSILSPIFVVFVSLKEYLIDPSYVKLNVLKLFT